MITALLLPLLLAAPSPQASAARAAGRTPPDPRSPAEIAAAAPAADWRAVAADDLLVMELTPNAQGRMRRVTIQLMPPPFSQGWIANIRLLAQARWWDGLSVNRVQDNYVAQWGDASEKKALPAGLGKVAESGYVWDAGPTLVEGFTGRLRQDTGEKFGAVVATGAKLLQDAYAGAVGFREGWPIGWDDPTPLSELMQRSDQTLGRSKRTLVAPVHCYGTVGVGRDLSPNTGTGAELYTVIGHAPRHLDRNIAVVGRVVEGIEHLSSLPRGTAPLGFYKTAAERTPIRTIRLASDLPAAERPRFQYLSTESASFAAYADARANRRDAFFIRPAGGADICNVPVPVQRAP